MLIITQISQVSCEAVTKFRLSSGEVISPRKGEGFLEIKIENAPPIREVFFKGEHLREYLREPQVFFGQGYSHFCVAFPLKNQTPDAVKAFKTFAEKYWLNQEVDA